MIEELEELDDIAEELADKLGIYGEERSHWTGEFQRRILRLPLGTMAERETYDLGFKHGEERGMERYAARSGHCSFGMESSYCPGSTGSANEELAWNQARGDEVGIKASREHRRQLAIENASYPDELKTIPRERWAAASWDDTERREVWRSKKFLVQIFAEKDGAERMTVSRTTLERNGHWTPGITWEDLQTLKQECGRGGEWAVEIYPANGDLVNVANMRHLWILKTPPLFGWKKR